MTGGSGAAAVPLRSDGRFDVQDLPAGPHELVLEGPPYAWWRLARFELDPGRPTDLGALRVPRPGTLRVASWWGGSEPMGDASYLLERRADFVTVLSFRGTFPDELDLAPGVYALQTEVTPGPQREVSFEIGPGEVTELELDLSPTCFHRVRIGYASGRATFGSISLRVRMLDEDFVVFSDRLEADGGEAWTTELELASGRFELVATDGEGRVARATESLYTSRPGREISLWLDDVEETGADPLPPPRVREGSPAPPDPPVPPGPEGNRS